MHQFVFVSILQIIIADLFPNSSKRELQIYHENKPNKSCGWSQQG